MVVFSTKSVEELKKYYLLIDKSKVSIKLSVSCYSILNRDTIRHIIKLIENKKNNLISSQYCLNIDTMNYNCLKSILMHVFNK